MSQNSLCVLQTRTFFYVSIIQPTKSENLLDNIVTIQSTNPLQVSLIVWLMSFMVKGSSLECILCIVATFLWSPIWNHSCLDSHGLDSFANISPVILLNISQFMIVCCFLMIKFKLDIFPGVSQKMVYCVLLIASYPVADDFDSSYYCCSWWTLD